MERECENLRMRSSKKEGFYTVLRIDFHFFLFFVLALLDGTSGDMMYWKKGADVGIHQRRDLM